MLQKEVKNVLTAGFTLVETMIALAILGVIIAAVMMFIGQSNDNMLVTETVTYRSMITGQLDKTVSDFQNILYSARNNTFVGNKALLRCIDDKAGTCDITSPDKQVSFNLLIPRGSTSLRIAGTQSNPVRYNRMGSPNCAASSGACPFWRARAYFWGLCPGGKTTCEQVSTLFVRYQLEPVKATYLNQKLAAWPPEPEFTAEKSKFAVSHRLFQEGLKSNQECPLATEQIGIDANGKIKCQCRYGFTQTGLDENNFPVCQVEAKNCKENEILQGRKKDGSPVCTPVSVHCEWTTFDSKDATCPNGGWMEKINLGYCRPKPKGGKKDTSRNIKCDTNKGYCCWYAPK